MSKREARALKQSLTEAASLQRHGRLRSGRQRTSRDGVSKEGMADGTDKASHESEADVVVEMTTYRQNVSDPGSQAELLAELSRMRE